MPRHTKSSHLDEVFDALANPTRRAILDSLLTGEHTAGELAGRFDMARPSVSEHLRTLRASGLVEERQVGRHRLYRVTAEPMAALAHWLSPYERFWRDRMTALGGVLQELDGADDER